MRKIAVVSENSFFRHALLNAVDSHLLTVVFEANGMSDFKNQFNGRRLDLVVFELSNVDSHFLATLTTLHAQRPSLRTLLILPTFDLDVLNQVFCSGCCGCVPSSVPIETITHYLLLATQGQRILPDMAVDLLQSLAKKKTPLANADALASKLTNREQHVLSHLLTGEQNKQIANRLEIPLTTVKGDLKSIMRKTGAQNRTALAIAAVKTGWSEPCR